MMKTQNIGPFLGVNNRLPDFALHVDQKGDYLSAADNVDIDNTGRIRRRQGVALVQALTGAHSLYLTSDTAGYLVRASVLYAITLPVYAETVVTALSSNATMSYAELGSELYYSNGTDSGRVAGSVAKPWALPTPPAPVVSAIDGGSLWAGEYLVATSYCCWDGVSLLEEGGRSPLTRIERTTTGGLRVTIPGAATGATHVNIYLSNTSGSVLYLLAKVTASTATYDVAALPTGREAGQRVEAPLPAGALFVHNGRLCSFSGSTVSVGLPFRPGYYAPVEGFIPFPETVSIAVSAQTGVFVAADKTYWIPGDLGDVQGPIIDVLPFGAVHGTAFSDPNSSNVGWFSLNGVVIGTIQGAVSTPMAEAIDLTAPASGNSAVFTTLGCNRVVSCGWCLNLDTGAATTYSGWDFTGISRGYGIAPGGIYRFVEDGVVHASVGFGRLNFGTDSPKRLPAAYASVSSTERMELVIAYADGDSNDWECPFLARSSSPQIGPHRFDLARGMLASLFDITLRNPEGGAFTLASIAFVPSPSQRRIFS